MLMSLKDIPMQLTLEHLQVDISKCDNTSNYVFLRVQPCELADLQIESPIVGEGTYGEYHLTVIYHPFVRNHITRNHIHIRRGSRLM
jgi:hypothetical protein